jgi:hypothetical protein
MAKVDLASLSYSCRHDGRGKPVQPPMRGVARREVDGQCPVCKKRAALRAEREQLTPESERQHVDRVVIGREQP